MKDIIEVLIFIASIVLALYVGLWMLFIQPIIACCVAFDAGALTGTMVGWTVIKCIFASAVASIIIYIGSLISALISGV